MTYIFINLKRFDVPRELGGLCDYEDPYKWITSVIQETVEAGVPGHDTKVVFMVPEALVYPTANALKNTSLSNAERISVGIQGVYREDISPEGNFGAFTYNVPAAAAKNLGASWAIIGHSEERKDMMGVLSAYDQQVITHQLARGSAQKAVDRLLAQEVDCALNRGLKVLFCIGETAED